VPVALVTTPQLYTAQRAVERQTGWNADQFIGRIGHVERLPERLAEADLMAVAAAMLPEGDAQTQAKLAISADISKKHLASIEAIVKRARWLAAQDGRAKATVADVDAAINESVIPSDLALESALRVSRQGQPVSRADAANLSPLLRGRFAGVPSGDFNRNGGRTP
jgi:hypothetical protein